ncbi:MAG TPA: hypothetical protein VLB50_00695 [Ignavibacteriaceae bacterium]|nr:hypothetical protein [Ignavibacteriaceae bacterium]
MRSLSFLILILIAAGVILAQSPHGKDLNLDCSFCHESVSWNVNPDSMKFNHDVTGFKLIGQHKVVDCKSCHQTLIFSEAKKIQDCFSCHKDIHRGSVGFDCERCHTPQSWIVRDINVVHQESRFPLVGAHRLADCEQCHKDYQDLNFQVIQIDCYSCHQTDYAAAQNPDHITAGFSTNCEDCHDITSMVWSAFNFRHDFFPLVGGHNIRDCFACHQQGSNFKGLSTDCYSCHEADYRATTDPNHQTLNFPQTCQDCHTINGWSPANFDHNTTQFPLTGAHKTIECSACHSQGFAGTPMDCYSCHQSTYNSASNPNHVAAGISTNCIDCHNTTAFIPSTFNHSSTGFELTGRHVGLECSSCHQGTTSNADPACFSCHQADYNGAENHLAQHYPTDCTLCHNTNSWGDTNFDHNTTGFPLTGAHQTTDCSACHQNGFSTPPPTDCMGCHQANFNATTNPNHQAIGIPTNCENCHTTNPGWQPASFPIHNNYYELIGAHAAIANDCAQCHNGNYNNTPNQCYGCHATDYNNTTDPNHQAAGFGTDCQTCHSQTAWQPATFDHDTQFFPIYSGSHEGKWQNCSDCHTQSNDFTVFTCITCHEINQTNEQHPGVQGYIYESNACYACHPTGSGGGAFNHDLSGFPLTGAHLTVDCVQCHPNGYNTPPPTVCSGCHQADYNGTTNPNHQSLGISTDCETCHTTNPGWQPAQFPQHNQYFELIGQHALITNCNDCHNGNYNLTSTACLQCHQNDYNSAANPNHVAAGIPTTCEDCHTANGWTPSTFNHSTTGFVLDGAHAPLQCSACHQGVITGLNPECVSCHQNDYNNAANPNHVAAGIPTTCGDCHTTNGWTPSTFNHSTTGFVLDGAHASLQCSACHQGVITGLNPECVSCHQNDYNNAANPNHVAAGIPVTCQDCHTTTAFIPSTFNHATTGFQLLGVHAQIQCSECHQGVITGLSPECYPCHQNDYNNAPNHVTLNYPTNCEMCHGFDGWIPSTFDHNTTNFPLTGAHLQVPCSSCHQNGFVGTPTACFACHETDYNNSSNPSHTALQLPTDCQTCHTTNPGWQPATFPIHSNYFQFVGAHIAIQNDCYVCHQGDYNNTPNTCYGCHSDNYNATTDPPHQQLNFPHECLNCHTQDAWQPATFDHSFYILYGNHSTMDCNNCHSEANYQPQCLSCHYNDFLEGHQPGDPTNCWNCHSTNHFGNAKPLNNIKVF